MRIVFIINQTFFLTLTSHKYYIFRYGWIFWVNANLEFDNKAFMIQILILLFFLFYFSHTQLNYNIWLFHIIFTYICQRQTLEEDDKVSKIKSVLIAWLKKNKHFFLFERLIGDAVNDNTITLFAYHLHSRFPWK